MRPIFDIMTICALEQSTDSVYKEFDRDIWNKMNKYAKEESKFFTCKNCGDFQKWKSHCDKWGTARDSKRKWHKRKWLRNFMKSSIGSSFTIFVVKTRAGHISTVLSGVWKYSDWAKKM